MPRRIGRTRAWVRSCLWWIEQFSVEPIVRFVMRWLVSPLLLAFLSIGIGIVTLQADLTGRVFNIPLLLTVAAVSGVSTAIATGVLLHLERQATVAMHDHWRHCALVYLAFLGCLPALGGGHGAIVFIFPFAASLGSLLSNAILISRARPAG